MTAEGPQQCVQVIKESERLLPVAGGAHMALRCAACVCSCINTLHHSFPVAPSPRAAARARPLDQHADPGGLQVWALPGVHREGCRLATSGSPKAPGLWCARPAAWPAQRHQPVLLSVRHVVHLLPTAHAVCWLQLSACKTRPGRSPELTASLRTQLAAALMHQDPASWAESQSFIPERWLADVSPAAVSRVTGGSAPGIRPSST